MQPAVSELPALNRILLVSIAILALAGVVVSTVSLSRHYAKSATGFCDLSQKFNCDIVNRSEYSEVEGIPVAAIGVVGYAALAPVDEAVQRVFLRKHFSSGWNKPRKLITAQP